MNKYSPPSPEEILAFSEKYARRMYKSERWQKFDREDFSQELAIKLLRAAERYDSKKNVPWSAYAHIIARGAFLDWYRRINNHETLLWDTSNDSAEFGADELFENLLAVEDFVDFTPKEIVEWSKQFSVPKRKVIICLALGYTRSETARLIGVTEGRVTRIIRGIQGTLRKESAKSYS